MVYWNLIISIVAIGFSTLALWGYGALFCSRVLQSGQYAWPLVVGLGLSVVLFLGGILNLASLAYGPSLWGVLIVGLILACIYLPASINGRFKTLVTSWECVGIMLVIGTLTLFAILTQASPSAFNFHDDFHKYFVHPLRMLATGTLSGSTMNGLGAQTFGGQAFLHGFVVSLFPLHFINAVDAVFSFFLLMTLGALAGWRRRFVLPVSIVAPVLIAVINPQYVNVSALYTGALLIATASMLVALNEEKEPASPAALGLVYAGMTALKTSFAIFPAFHLPLLVLILWRRNNDLLAGLMYGIKATGWAAIAITPWILMYVADYSANRTLPDTDVPPSSFNVQISRLFSTGSLFYGGASYLHYTALVIVSWVAIAFLYLKQRLRNADAEPEDWRECAVAAIIAASLVYVLVAGVMTPKYLPPEAALRYTMPIIIGAIVPSLIIALSVGADRNIVVSGASLVCLAILIAAFLPSTANRYQQAWTSGNILAFPLGQDARYIKLNRAALSESTQDEIQRIQSLVPAGATMLAWTGTSFHMDYARNKIVDVDANSIATRWAHVPATTQYILWQYQGFGVRTPQEYEAGIKGSVDQLRLTSFTLAYAFARHLVKLANSSEALYRDRRFILFRIQENDGIRR